MDSGEAPVKAAVIGSGPAGWTAALYLARAQLEPLMLEGELSTGGDPSETILPGGQLMTTTEIENFPGFPKGGISGPDLMIKMQEQAEEFGTKTVSETVTKIEMEGSIFALHTRKKVYRAVTVILATGATAKYLGLPSEDKYMNNGVSACATCDGALPRFRKKPLVVVGGGDTAMEEASFLARFGSRVFIIHRRDKLRASAVMQKRVLAHEKIEVVWNSVVQEIVGNEKDGVTGVRVKNTQTNEEKTIEASGYFAAIGHKPNSDLVKDMVTLDESGYIVAEPAGTSKTKIDGFFVCGDVQDKVYRQAITAAGTGCMAAIDATRYLETLE